VKEVKNKIKFKFK